MKRRRREQTERNQHGERADFQDHQHVEHAAAWLHAKNIDEREDYQCADRKWRGRQVRLPDQTQRVCREGDGDGGDRAALDHGEKRPSVEKAGERMESVAQIRILAPYARKNRPELGIRQRTGNCDRASDRPRGQHERRTVQPSGDDVGIDEDA